MSSPPKAPTSSAAEASAPAAAPSAAAVEPVPPSAAGSGPASPAPPPQPAPGESPGASAGEGLRVALISHSAHLAGSEQVLLQLVKELIRDRGAVCRVVVPDHGPLGPLLKAAGAEVVVVRSHWWAAAGPLEQEEIDRRLGRSLAWVMEVLLEDMARFDPDVVLSITTVSPWGALVARLIGRPHVWYLTDFGESPHGLTFFFPFDRVLEAIAGSSQRVPVISRAVLERLFPRIAAAGNGAEGLSSAPASPEHYPVVHGRVEVGELADHRVAQTFFERPDALKLGVFGTVRASKGQGTAIRAVAELVRRGHDVELVLTGYEDEEHAAELRQLVEELGLSGRVRFLGVVEDQYSVMDQADVVVITSREETFCLVAAEALLLGKPLVTTPVGGIVEFVEDGESGLWFPPDEPEELVERLERLVRDPELAERLGETGRRRARERFTADAFGGRLYAILEEAAREGRRPGPPPPLFRELLARVGTGGAAPGELLELAGRIEETEGYNEELERRLAKVTQLARHLGARSHRLTQLVSARTDERNHLEGHQRHLEGELERREAECQRLEGELSLRIDQIRELSEIIHTIQASRSYRFVSRLWNLLRRSPG